MGHSWGYLGSEGVLGKCKFGANDTSQYGIKIEDLKVFYVESQWETGFECHMMQLVLCSFCVLYWNERRSRTGLNLSLLYMDSQKTRKSNHFIE